MIMLINNCLFFRNQECLLKWCDFSPILNACRLLFYWSFPFFDLFYDVWLKRWLFLLHCSSTMQHRAVQDAQFLSLLTGKTWQNMRLFDICCRRLCRYWIFYIFHKPPLLARIAICYLVGLDLEYLYPQPKFLKVRTAYFRKIGLFLKVLRVTIINDRQAHVILQIIIAQLQHQMVISKKQIKRLLHPFLIIDPTNVDKDNFLASKSFYYCLLQRISQSLCTLFTQLWCFILYSKNQQMSTVYQKLGGEAAISSVVDKFYQCMLADPVVNYFFANTDMKKQIQRQKQFITLVTGGPNNYQGVDMKKAHSKFKISKKQFDATWSHLEHSLTFHGVSQELIGQVKDIFYSVQDDVVNIKQEPKSLYLRLGGEAAIDAVVDKFYEFMLADPVVSPFFSNTDMEKQRKRQKQFITLVTGGPNHYEGVDMKAAHAKFKISKKQYDETWANLEKALHFFKAPQAEIDQLKIVFYSVQQDIVNVKPSLYQRLGGEAAINAVVDKFYEYMLSDPVVSPFFANTDMEKQRKRQKQFITLVTGGPNKYEGVDMKTAHAKFKISKKQYDQTWINLEKSLHFFKAPQAEIDQLKTVFYSVEGDIVNVKPSLYDRFGGEAAINAVVDKFYEYMLSDPIVSPFFANTDMERQRKRQKQFITLVTGGPNHYEGTDMKTAHAKFKINKKEYDQTWINLEKSLHFFKAPQAEIDELKVVFYSVEADIVNVQQTLYERLGGQAAISAVVDKFYEYMLADPVVSPFFANTDMEKQRKRQKQFITLVTGGPNHYEGTDMKTAHAKFKISHKEYDETWTNLEKALHFFKVANKQINELKAVFYSVQDDIVNVKKSLYQRLGGEAAINAVVDKFYEYMLSDPVVSPFFANTDMEKQRKRQKQFITLVTGGPNKYEGVDMKTAHAKFKISKKQYDQTWINLEKSLHFFKAPQAEIDQLKTVFYSVEGDIVNVKKSLYDRLGGEAAIDVVVDKFYEFMLADPVVSPFFSNTDMEKQRKRQKQFITFVTGGPNHYEGTDMKTAHSRFKISKRQFDETWVNLEKSLHFFNVPAAQISELKEVFYSVESDVETVKQCPFKASSSTISEKEAKQFSKKVLLGSNVGIFKTLIGGFSPKKNDKRTLFERLGGEAAISAVVDKFYDYMLADPVVSPFFANTDIMKQRCRQKQFITMVVGGPNNYEGADMKSAHAKFKISKKEFDQTWYNLEKSLSFFKVPAAEANQLKEVFYSVESDVLTVKDSLYTRLGGQAAISAVVDKFYEYMLADPVVSPFFANTDMEKQRKRQKQFITLVTGGPNHYEGTDMKTAHAKFKISHKEFNETWTNLDKALRFFKVKEGEIAELKSVFYSVEGEVLTV